MRGQGPGRLRHILQEHFLEVGQEATAVFHALRPDELAQGPMPAAQHPLARRALAGAREIEVEIIAPRRQRLADLLRRGRDQLHEPRIRRHL